MSIITRGIIIEDSAATLLDQVELNGSTTITAADFSSITVRSFNLDTGALVKTTTISPVTGTEIVALAVADGWTRDSVGRNAKLALDGTHWPTGGTSYRVEVTYTPSEGDGFISIYELQAIEVYGG